MLSGQLKIEGRSPFAAFKQPEKLFYELKIDSTLFGLMECSSYGILLPPIKGAMYSFLDAAPHI